MRWATTVLIGLLAIPLNIVPFVLLTRGVEPAYNAGRIVGLIGFCFIAAVVLAAIWGRFSNRGDGAFHRRVNWLAIILMLASAAGQLGQIAGHS